MLFIKAVLQKKDAEG